MQRKKKILLVGGSLNQTQMMHKISWQFPDCDVFFTPFYTDGIMDFLVKQGALDFTILGGQFRQSTLEYLKSHQLEIDHKGLNNSYDLVFTCQDLIVPSNLKNKKVVLVQEGMTDPETLAYHLVKSLKLPRWIASTAATGLSGSYDLFCVASEGYRELFIRKGVNPRKIRVTGIPNFDHASELVKNDFPYRNYVLVATSDRRETFNYENRRKFIHKCLSIAQGRQLIFKLHPNENHERAKREIELYAPGAIVYTSGNIGHMIANCDVLVTRYSSVVYLGIALGKEVHSDFDLKFLERLCPIQNGGTSAENIAAEARKLMNPSRSYHYSEVLAS